MEGVLVHQDDLKFLRFDFYSDGSSTWIHCASFTDGQPTRIYRSVISSGAPLYMRVKRAADLWTQSFSTDGSSWTDLPAFTFIMQMRTLGIFAGNAGLNPAFSLLADYFLNISGYSAPSSPSSHRPERHRGSERYIQRHRLRHRPPELPVARRRCRHH